MTGIPSDLAAWCPHNGYTDTFCIDGHWWGFKGNDVQPTPLPYCPKGIESIAPIFTLKITFDCGILTYQLSDDAIASADWVPNDLYGYQCETLSFAVGMDLLEIENNKVTWRLHVVVGGGPPIDWRTEKDANAGIVVTAIAQSIEYFVDEGIAV